MYEIDFSNLSGLYYSADPNTPGTNGPMSAWIADRFPEGYQGYCIDVGASDGFNVNSTFVLEKIFLWNVLSVEPNPEFHFALQNNRAFVEMCACAEKPSESEPFSVCIDFPEQGSALRPSNHPIVGNRRWRQINVRVETVDRLLNKWQFPRLDALCIDVEGGESGVLAGANLDHWKPKVIVVESWDQGSLDGLLPQYERVWSQKHNDCYLRRGDGV